jgi:dethiobiotin synthetase
MVPLNEIFLIIDLIKKLDAEVILVSKNYLGSINHTLLSVEILKMRKIKINRLVFCGDRDLSSEKVISNYSNCDIIRVPHFEQLNSDSIRKFADDLDF